MIAATWADFAYYLLTDPKVLGAIAWLGLTVTIAGFWVALVQISKIKSAAQAANDSFVGLSKVVRAQEQSAKVAEAMQQLTSAQAMMRQQNFDAAAAHLSVGWTLLMTARELSNVPADRKEIGLYVVATRRLLDDISSPAVEIAPSAELAGSRHEEISRTLGGLGMIAARLSVNLLGIGTDQ